MTLNSGVFQEQTYLLQQQCIEKNKFSILFQSSNIFVSIKKILYIFMTFLYQLNEM